MIKNRRIARATLMIWCLTFLITACQIQSPATTGNITASMPALIRIPLEHTPIGTANLLWNSANHTLMVTISATGLAPKSTHLVHIHSGNCNAMGQIVYSLSALVANAKGVGSSKTTITAVNSGIPSSGWGINIHNGATFASSLEARPIACGNVSMLPPTMSGIQSARALLSATPSPNENVHGMAQIRFMGSTIIVTLSLAGLAPRTTHMAHIHVGSCASQGPVLYPLQPVTADPQGNAMTVTTIQVKATVPSRWYINVHEAGTMAAMMMPSGFDPISCGDGTSSL